MSLKYLSPLLAFSLSLALSGCAVKSAEIKHPEFSPLGRDISTFHPPAKPNGEGSEYLSEHLKAEEPTDVLTLRQALSLALLKSPELAAFSWEVRAGEARRLQAGLLPNPQVDISAEEFGGSGSRSAYNAAETSILLSQLVELGGKRAKRTEVAAIQGSLAGWDYESKRLDVFTDTTKAFVETLAAQSRFALARESFGLAKQVFQTVSERSLAGKVSPLEVTKAKVALSISRISLERTKRELETARKSLAATWGSYSTAFTRAEGSFETINEVPPLNHLLQQVNRNPDIARRKIETELRRARVNLEKSEKIPNLTIGAGLRRFEETDDSALIFELSLPLLLFDRNQGNILEAKHNLAKALEENRATNVRIIANLGQTHQVLSSSYLEAVTLKNDVLPGAYSAFNAAREGYKQGKFGYLDVLDAQRTLFETKAGYIAALAEYHKAMADAERLIGQRLTLQK